MSQVLNPEDQPLQRRHSSLHMLALRMVEHTPATIDATFVTSYPVAVHVGLSRDLQ